MAMEMHVLFRGKLPDKKTLSRTMADLGFPLTIAAGSLERQRGFMPMRLRREETGVEFDVFDGRAAVEELGGKDVDPSLERSANFRWGGNEDEMLAGICAAAALAKLVHGVVLEEQEGKLLSPDQAIVLARETLQATSKPEETPRRGTRPADIKRYLKPLLQQRSDLVLIGRMLVIRPVRHILRGALFDRTSDKYRFTIWPYLMPLWSGPPESVGYLHCIHDRTWHVWQPHFEPWLMDCLAADVFALVGQITTHHDFATTVSRDDDSRDACVHAFVLAGEHDRAVEYVRDIEARRAPRNDYYTHWADRKRRFLAGEIENFCVRSHAREAETVKALKLESIWEPSPFPVEVFPTGREERTAEPPFSPQPWPAGPKWLLGDPPEQVGDVRFAKGLLYRSGKPLLLVPLSREQARERHQDLESYVLAARLTAVLFLLLRWPGVDREDPRRIGRSMWKYSVSPDLEIQGGNFLVRASFSGYDIEDKLLLRCVYVDERQSRRRIWGWHFDRRELHEAIRDERSGTQEMHYRQLSDCEIDQLLLAVPGFCGFGALVDIVLNKLRDAGYGEIT